MRKKLWEDFVDCKDQAARGKRGEEVKFCWIPSGSRSGSTRDRQKLRNVPQGEKLPRNLEEISRKRLFSLEGKMLGWNVSRFNSFSKALFLVQSVFSS